MDYKLYTELLESLGMSVFDVLVKYGCPDGHFKDALEDFYLIGSEVSQYDQQIVFWHIGAHADANVLRFLSKMVDISDPDVFALIKTHVAKLDWVQLTESIVDICREESTVNNRILEFCNAFASNIVWTDLCKHMGLYSEYSALWTGHKDRIVWSAFYDGDAETVAKYQERLDWAVLCAQSYFFNEIDDEQFAAIEHRVIWSELSKNDHLGFEFVEKHFARLDHKIRSEHHMTFPRAKYFARNAGLLNLEIIKYLDDRKLHCIRQEIKKLETMYTPVKTSSDFICAICRSCEPQGVVQSKCKHCFHMVCITLWNDRVTSCPLCRAAI
jgi:hypothetical protein